MNLMTIISFPGLLLNLMEGFLVYQILGHFARKRNGKFWSIAVFFSCGNIANMVIFPNDLFNVTMDLIWFPAMMLTAFHGSIWQKLAAVAILYPLIISQNFLVMELLGHLGESLGWPAAIDIFCTIADPVLHLLIWYGIYKLFEKHLAQARKLFDEKTWMMLDIVCLASLASITTCIYFSPKESYKMWPAAFACFATNPGCIALAEYFVNSIRQNMERKNLMLQKHYYEELEQNQNEIRKFRHDMNNHLSVIQSLFRSGEQEEAERNISVKARVTDNGYFSYEIRNSKRNAVVVQPGGAVFKNAARPLPPTDKEEAKDHGLGLSNVQEMVEKYEGTLDISYTEDTFTVTVLIGNA